MLTLARAQTLSLVGLFMPKPCYQFRDEKLTSVLVDDYCPSRFETPDVIAAWLVAASAIIAIALFAPGVRVVEPRSLCASQG
jgi:hypothetical protein